MANEMSVKLAADATAFAAGVDGAKTQIISLQQTVNQLQVNFGSLTAATEKQGEAFKKAGEGAGKGASALKSFKDLVGGLGGIASQALAVAGQIVEWGQKVGEQGEKVRSLGTSLGMSSSEVQRMGAAAKFAGGDLDKAGKASEGLNNAFAKAKGGAKEQADAFRQLGVDTTKTMSASERMTAVSAGLAKMADGPQKAALAQKLFGDSAEESAKLLTDMGQHADQANAAIDKYGLANAGAADEAAALGDAFKEGQSAFDGIQSVLIDALAPALTSVVGMINDLIAGFIQSYASGGAVKQIFDVLTVAVKVIQTIFLALIVVIEAYWHWMQHAFEAAVSFVTDLWKELVKLGQNFTDMGHAAGNAIQPVIDWLKSAWDWIVKVSRAMLDWLSKIPGLGKVLKTDVKLIGDTFKDVVKDAKNAAAEIQKVWNAADAGPASKGGAPASTGGAGGGGANGGSRQGGGRGHGGTETKTEDKWLEGEKQRLATSLEQRENWRKDATRIDQKFWQDIIDDEKQSNEHREQARRELKLVERELDKQDQAAQLAKVKSDETIALDGMKSRYEIAKEGYEQEKALIDQAVQDRRMSSLEALREKDRIDAQLRKMAQEEAEAEYQIKLRELNNERALAEGRPREQAAIDLKIQEIEKAHLNKMDVMRKQDANAASLAAKKELTAYEQAWKKVMDPIAKSFGDMIHGMITGTMTLRQAVLQIGDSILKGMISKFVSMAEEWLIQHVFMKQTSAAWAAFEKLLGISGKDSNDAIAVADINASAARAGAATYASIAAIPIVGPALAPGAAAAATMAVQAMSAMVGFSAAGGWGDVPFDGAVTELHKNEMVLPASIATPLRAALGAGQTGGLLAAASPGGVGDIHIHTMEPRTMQWWLKNGGGVEIKRYLNQALRSRLMPQPF